MAMIPNELRERIREEATRLFAIRGFAGTHMSDVAEACQCTKPGLYYHFSSKEALFRDVVETHAGRITGLMESTVKGEGSVRACLHAGVEGMIDYCMRAPLVMRLMQRMELSSEDTAPVLEACAAREAHLHMLAGLVARGIGSGELRASLHALDGAMLIAGAIHFQLEQSIASGQWDRARIHRTIDLVLDGIAT